MLRLLTLTRLLSPLLCWEEVRFQKVMRQWVDGLNAEVLKYLAAKFPNLSITRQSMQNGAERQSTYNYS